MKPSASHSPSETLASSKLKGSIVFATRKNTGAAVLNAADPLVVEMEQWCRGQVVFFSRDPDLPLLAQHLAKGGLAATVRDGWIVLCDGPRETRLAHLDRVPIVHRGAVGFQIDNVLAAAAAAWRLGVPLELVRLGLETFPAGRTGSPGRFNLMSLDGAGIVCDYGHNPASLEQICAAMERLPHDRLTAVYSAAGDRRDEDILDQGRMLGRLFQRVVVYEDAYMRGRQPGEITRLLTQGVREGMSPDRPVDVEFGGTWPEAAALVLDACRPGELILLQPDTIEQTIPWLQARYGQRLREISFGDLAAGASVGTHDRRPGAGEPVEVRTGAVGRSIHATRDLAAGEILIRTWGPSSATRTPHSMQVDARTHVVPEGAIVYTNHSCDPNCMVRVSIGSREIALLALRPLSEGEEITIDYDTFEYEVEHLPGPCRCGSPRCRGTIAGYKHLSPEVKARYGEMVAEYLRIMESEVPLPNGV